MTEYWWRSWHGAPMDHKWPVVAARANVKVGIVSAVAWALLDYASQHSDRGSVEGFDTEAYAIYSGFPQKEIEAVIQAMADKGVIKDNRLTNWEKRQPKREDDSRERVRNWRAGKRSVTPGNGGKPPDKDTEADAETEPDKEKEADKDTGGDIDLVGELGSLQAAFITASRLPSFGISERAIAAYRELKEMGASPEDIAKVVQEIRDKYGPKGVVGPWSIVTPMRICLSSKGGPLYKPSDQALAARQAALRSMT